MKLTLNAISIHNFKGIAVTRIDFHGTDAVISGRNVPRTIAEHNPHDAPGEQR